MTESWRSKVTVAPLEDDDTHEVKRPSHSRRGHEHESSNSRHKDERDKHHHRSHKRHRKSKSPNFSRKRSRSRSRDRNRSSSSSTRYNKDKSQKRHGHEGQEDDYSYRDRSSHKPDRHQRSRSSSRDRDRSKDCNRLGGAENNEIPLRNLARPNLPIIKPTIPSEAAKLKEEIERRKQLWTKKDKPAETEVSSVWKQPAFIDDSDGKVSAKFKRLMGMKDGGSSSQSERKEAKPETAKQKQDEYFANLEKQYEVARATTHTQRGLGLGFSGPRILPR